MPHPTPDDIAKTLLDRFEGAVLNRTWGETAIFYNPGRQLPLGVYFATLKDRDGPNDRASHLNRDGVFRLSVGAGQAQYRTRFGATPQRPGKGRVVEGDWDFEALDRLTPHPVYGWMGWVAVLSPSAARLRDIDPLLETAYAKAVQSFDRCLRSQLRRRDKELGGAPQFC